jgi:hypothetical protein
MRLKGGANLPVVGKTVVGRQFCHKQANGGGGDDGGMAQVKGGLWLVF